MFGKKHPQFTDEPATSKHESALASVVGVRLARTLVAAFEILQIGVLSLTLVILIRVFLIQPFYVKGASMEPTFQNQEYLIIDEISYRFREPERGEVVVFRPPQNPKEYFIKRIIGKPGEVVQISGGQVSINGVVLNEPYLTDIPTSHEERVRLGSDEYFLMGDNRPVSLDSRFFGPVSRQAIVGRVWFRGWPPSRISIFDEPNYNL